MKNFCVYLKGECKHPSMRCPTCDEIPTPVVQVAYESKIKCPKCGWMMHSKGRSWVDKNRCFEFYTCPHCLHESKRRVKDIV